MSQEWIDQHLWLILLVAAWELFWKAWALWRSARAGSKPWFIVLLLVNTLGILQIAYIFIFSKQTSSKK